MRLGIQNDDLDSLKDLPNATAILKRAVETVSVSSEKNKKRIKKLCKNRNKSGKGETKIVANVETSNRFAPLAHACIDNDPRSHHTKSAKPKCHTRVKRSRKTKSKRNVNDNKKRKVVKIIGASMVRGQGKLVTDKTQGISACCFPCLGANMMTSSNGNIFRVNGHLCGEFTGPGEVPAQRPGTRSFDVFFDLRPNKRLSKQPWGWWFETPSWSLWRQCNVLKLATTKRFSVGVVRHTTNKWVYWKRWLHA